jgi:hypothetical protein
MHALPRHAGFSVEAGATVDLNVSLDAGGTLGLLVSFNGNVIPAILTAAASGIDGWFTLSFGTNPALPCMLIAELGWENEQMLIDLNGKPSPTLTFPAMLVGSVFTRQ